MGTMSTLYKTLQHLYSLTVVLDLFKSPSGPATSASSSTNGSTTAAVDEGGSDLVAEPEVRAPEARTEEGEETKESGCAGVTETKQSSNGAGRLVKPKHPLAMSVWLMVFCLEGS